MDDVYDRFDRNDIPLETLPNTTVTIRHLPTPFRQTNPDILFHDTSTDISFSPSTEHTTVVNIHPAPRVNETPFMSLPSVQPPFSYADSTISSIAPLNESMLPEI